MSELFNIEPTTWTEEAEERFLMSECEMETGGLVPPETPGPHKCGGPGRRFPGPAGITRRPSADAQGAHEEHSDNSKVFASTGWLAMLEEHGKSSVRNGEDFNVHWANQKTCTGMIKRAPVLKCAIKSVDLTCVDPSLLLHDRSGSIRATVHR